MVKIVNVTSRKLPNILRMMFIGVIFSLALIACATTSSPRPTSYSNKRQPLRSTTRAVPICSNSQLKVSLEDHGVGAGSRYFTGTIENVGATRCAVESGYVRLQLIGKNNQPLPTKDRYINSLGQPISSVDATKKTKAQQIVLKPKASASFLIILGDGSILTPPLPACPIAVKVKITLPSSPGAPRHGILAPTNMVAYPYFNGGPCGVVTISPLIIGGANALYAIKVMH